MRTTDFRYPDAVLAPREGVSRMAIWKRRKAHAALRPCWDAEGYPSKAWLRRIRCAESVEQLVKLAAWAFNAHYGQWKLRRSGRIAICTGGWSGNEAILEAMQANPFWKAVWLSSAREGFHLLERRSAA